METSPRPGRPTKATPENIERAWDYALGEWKDSGDQIPMVEGLASFLAVHRDTLYARPEFEEVRQYIKQEQERTLVNNGLVGKFSPVVTKIMLMSKHNYTEKSESDITSKGEKLGTPRAGSELVKQLVEQLKERTKANGQSEEGQ